MKYAHQFVTTSLNVGGGIDDSQTTGIVIKSLNNVDATKPSVACISWADPLSTSVAEWVTYTSINSTTNELQGVTRGAEGYSAKSHSNGATVAFPISKSHINELNDTVLVEHNADGTHSDITADSINLNSGGKIADNTGWIPIEETFTYASATTITIAAGGASRYQKGDKLKLTQTTVKYFYVVGVADELLTITGGSDYTLANAAIESPYLSRIENPFGFPDYFSFTPTWTNLTVGSASNIGRFKLSGQRVHYFTTLVFAADTSISGAVSISLPISPDSNYAGWSVIGTVQLVDASPPGLYYGTAYGDNPSGIRVINAGSTYAGPTAISSTVPMTWTTNDYISTSFDYKIA